MTDKKIPEDVKFTESIKEDFQKDDFVLPDKVPALYEKMMSERSGRSSYRGKMTPARYEAIIKYIRNGAYIAHAANAVGIDDNTIYKWVKWGMEDPESIYGYFLEDLKRAKAAAVNRNVFIVQRAAEDDWTAAKWLLSVMEPEVFGNRSTVRTEVTGIDGAAIQATFVISDEELKKLTIIQDMVEEQNKLTIDVVDVDLKEVNELVESDKPKKPQDDSQDDEEDYNDDDFGEGEDNE